MGFGHRVYRAEDPRARLLKGTAKELGAPRYDVADKLEAGGARGAAEEVARPAARDERRVLVGRRPRRRRRAAAARAGDVRLLAHRGLVGAHPRAEEAEPARPAVGASTSARAPARPRRSDVTLQEAAAQADELAQRETSAGSRRCGSSGTRSWSTRRASADYRDPRAGLPRDRAVPLPPEARARPARAPGREPGRARLGADRARRPLARPSGRREQRCARCCTSSRPTTRTSRCAGSRSSA